MIFFSIDNRTSFESVKRWQVECQAVNESTPILLVASKVDLRVQANQSGEDTQLISEDEIKMKV